MGTGSTGQYGRLVQEKQLDFPFIAIFLFGAAAIALLDRLYGATLLTEAVPVCLMVLYGWTQWSGGQYENQEDRLGDNIYYLGFLFTLVSLMISLLALQRGSILSSVLVRNFGIALATTITGLFGRVILYQLRGDQQETAEQSMQKLGEQTRQTTFELSRAAEEMRRSYVNIGDSAKEFFKELSAATGQAVEQAVARMQAATEGTAGAMVNIGDSAKEFFKELSATTGQVVEQAVARMQAATEGTAGAIQKNLTTLQARIGKMNERVDGVAAALEQMAQRIGKVDIPTDLITAKIAPFADAVALALGRVEQAARAAADSNDRLSQALSRIQGNVVHINEAMLKLAEFTDNLGALVLLLKEIREEIARLAGGLKDASSTIIGMATNSASTLTELARQAGQDAELAARHRQDLEQTLQRTRALLQDITKDLKSAGMRVREQTEKDAELSALYRANLERELEKSRELTTELHDNAVSLIRFISDSLPNA
jgi:methyl-accepting chemotaxis protein